MSSLIANIRDTKTKGEVRDLRIKGSIPAILYGGKIESKKIYVDKKIINSLINSENFLSNILNMEINGEKEKVLPREVAYDPISDEPLHIDFLRIVDGAKIILEIPVKFINTEKSPGLKKGGVLNIVRRKVELKCPTENIPSELIVDLENTEIGTSIKISSIKLPTNVFPTIQGRDFVIATVASPTIVVEPEKPAEGEAAAEGAEGEAPVVGAEAATKDGKDGDVAKKDDKAKEGSEKKPEDKKPAEKKPAEKK